MTADEGAKNRQRVFLNDPEELGEERVNPRAGQVSAFFLGALGVFIFGQQAGDRALK
jgi:hypothetical protein